MNMRIKTKWGQIIVNPEAVFEVRVIMNPWDNIYKIEFIMEGGYEVLPAEVDNANELIALIRRITNELHFIKKYKFKDATGRMQINEPLRMAAMREKEKA